MKGTVFYKQAHLLLKVLPLISKERDLALKGGTAINLFIRDMPRLSVDVDLTYLPITDRNASLQNISESLKRIEADIIKLYPSVNIHERKPSKTDYLSGLIIREHDVLIKVEVNPTIRGAVFSPVEMSLSSEAVKLFEMDVTVQSLSFEDIYAGKICAALDRQHPRDLFDVKLLLENEGIGDKLKEAFLVYLISSNRPIIELLNPRIIDIGNSFKMEFRGMTFQKISIDELVNSRAELIKSLHSSLTESDIEFLLSFKRKNPKWKLIALKGVENLPSVQWKLLNIGRMEKKKHQEAYNKLKEFLYSLH